VQVSFSISASISTLAVFGALAAFSSAGLAQTWVSQGPAPAMFGQTEGMEAQGNPVTGAARVVLPHPENANIVYCGGTNGGVWRTDNALDLNPTWVPQTDNSPSMSIGSITFDTTDPTYQTLIAGIGRFSSLGRNGGSREGVLYTADGGLNWIPLGMMDLFERNVSSAIARNNVLLVGVEAGTLPGLYRSTDTGATFIRISGVNGTGFPTGTVFNLGGDPTNIARCYAAVGGINGGLFRTEDFGATWLNVTNGITNLPQADNCRIAVANGIVFVSVDRGGQLNNVYRSTSFGASWMPLGVPETDEGGCLIGVNPGAQGSIHMALAIDPSDPSIYYVSGDRQPTSFCDNGGFPNSIGAQNYSDRLFRGDVRLSPPNRYVPLTHVGTANNSSPHADSRSMAVDALGNLLEADDGGIYKRLLPKQTTGDWVSLNGNLALGEFHSAAWDHNSHIIIGGTQDCGTSEQVFPGSIAWRSVFSGDGGKVAIEQAIDGISYRYGSAQFLGGFHRRPVDANNVSGNYEFPDMRDQDTGQRISNGAQFYSPIATNRSFGPGLAILTGTHVYVSLDRGDTFKDLGAPGGTPTAVIYGGRRGGIDNAHALWIGATGNNLYFRDTFAGPLVDVPNYPGLTNSSVRWITTDPTDYGVVVVCDAFRVYISRDVGATWTNITSNLTDQGLRALEWLPDPINGDKILVGGLLGVLATSAANPGVWNEFAAGLPNVPVREIHYDSVDNLLLCATLGRGVWTLALNPTGPCIGDFNQDGGIDGQDVEAFFIAFEAGEASADVNQDGGVTGGDVETFFLHWEAGVC